MLQWLLTNGVNCGMVTSLMAAKEGQLDLLKWMKTNGHPIDCGGVYYAAKRGHLSDGLQ